MSKYFNNIVGRMNKSFGERIAKQISWKNVSGYGTEIVSMVPTNDDKTVVTGTFYLSSASDNLEISLPERYSNGKIIWSELPRSTEKSLVQHEIRYKYNYQFTVKL